MASAGMDDIEIPAFLRKQPDSINLRAESSICPSAPSVKKPANEATMQDIASTLNAAALKTTTFRQALQQTLKLNVPSEYAQIIIDLTKETKDSATSWALLFEWLFSKDRYDLLLDKHAQRLLRSQLTLASNEIQERSRELFERSLVAPAS